MPTPNESVIIRAYEAFVVGDMDSIKNNAFASDMRWIWPGSGPLAGEYNGVDEVLGLFGKLAEGSGGTFKVAPEDFLGHGDFVQVSSRASWTGPDGNHEDPYVQVFRLTDGKATECYMHVTDEKVWNTFRGDQTGGRADSHPQENESMPDQITTQGLHHFRLTVTEVDRAVAFYTEVLGFKKLMDLDPGAFLSDGTVGLGIGPAPHPERAVTGDCFDENRVGLDHLSFAVASRAALDDAVRVLDEHSIPHSEVRDLGEAFGICILVFRDPDNIQVELSGPRA